VASFCHYGLLAALTLAACAEPLAPEQVIALSRSPRETDSQADPTDSEIMDLALADSMIFCLRLPPNAHELLQDRNQEAAAD
jgi:hypothetical protein